MSVEAACAQLLPRDEAKEKRREREREKEKFRLFLSLPFFLSLPSFSLSLPHPPLSLAACDIHRSLFHQQRRTWPLTNLTSSPAAMARWRETAPSASPRPRWSLTPLSTGSPTRHPRQSLLREDGRDGCTGQTAKERCAQLQSRLLQLQQINQSSINS